MISAIFITTLAVFMTALLLWGFRTLPRERWQMIAAVPVAKDRDGEWRGMNLTFYGFFSATGSVFGIGMSILLLGSLHVSILVGIILVAGMMVLCLPASRMVAAIVEKKRPFCCRLYFGSAATIWPGLDLRFRPFLRWRERPSPMPLRKQLAASRA